jgi:hypothetical protein
MKTLVAFAASGPVGAQLVGLDAKRIYFFNYGSGQIGWVAR